MNRFQSNFACYLNYLGELFLIPSLESLALDILITPCVELTLTNSVNLVEILIYIYYDLKYIEKFMGFDVGYLFLIPTKCLYCLSVRLNCAIRF